MTVEPLTCPYCNAEVPVQPGMKAGQKISCPRCGEVFELLHTPAIQAPPPITGTPPSPAPPAASLTAPVPDLRTRPTRSNRLVGGLVLGVMLCMATLGLVYALATQGYRRAHDTGISGRARRTLFPPRMVEEPDRLVIAPARLAGLGYLPPDMGVLVGVHVEELLANPVGKGLLDQPLRVAGQDFPINNVLNWTTLRLEDIDHALLALEPDAPLSTTLVVRTRAPYDEKKIRTALEGRAVGGEGRKPLFSVQVAGLPVRPLLWCADDRTLLLSFSQSTLQSAPDKPREGLAHLPRPIREILEERIGTGGPVWAVAHADAWPDAVVGLLLGSRETANPEVERWKQVRSLGLWVQPPLVGTRSTLLTINASIGCASEEAARALETKSLRPWLPADTRLVQEGNWLTIQGETDLTRLRQALERKGEK
jgi:hypothetical protein